MIPHYFQLIIKYLLLIFTDEYLKFITLAIIPKKVYFKIDCVLQK